MSTPRAHLLSTVCEDYVERLTAEDDSGEPRILTCIPVVLTGAETADVDVTMLQKMEVVRVDCLKRAGAGAGNTITVKNSTTAITDAIACVTDNAVTSAGTIDDAQSTLDEGDTLKVTGTYAAGTLDALVLIYGLIRAA